jgi:hypothetical protein
MPIHCPLSIRRRSAALGKAALKTHALQTLTRRMTRPGARSVWSASDSSALFFRRGKASGSLLQCAIFKLPRLSIKLTWERPRPAGVSDSQKHQLAGETPALPGSWSRCAIPRSWRLSVKLPFGVARLRGRYRLKAELQTWCRVERFRGSKREVLFRGNLTLAGDDRGMASRDNSRNCAQHLNPSRIPLLPFL